jgi:hypothetical protein
MAKATTPDEKVGQEFADRIALFLKHDWDRAKNEAKHRKPPSRLTYEQFEKRRASGFA